jgi:1-deoxy-D-xylulose-5-phosphate reductoisomerase
MSQITRNIAILGSTGSIGRQALKVIAEQPHLRAVALGARSNWRLLAEQARLCGVKLVAVADEAAAAPLRAALGDGVTVLAGPCALSELVRQAPADTVLSAVVGACGVRAALAAIERRLPLAIANKETLVVAGQLITEQARRNGVPLLPVDSEHAAIRQCLQGREVCEVSRVIITASGGPFRTWTPERIAAASIEEALNHPTWDMGRKITIDSATMMNKALEVIEAHWLFGLSPRQIEVVIHPESIVHSAVEYRDGSMLAQLSWPDMTLPIAQALNDPEALPRTSRRLDLFDAGQLTFQRVDAQRFPAVALAWRVLEEGRGAGAVLNGANEAAVEAFLNGRIRFADIVRLAEQTLNQHAGADETDLDALLAADQWARARVQQAIT